MMSAPIPNQIFPSFEKTREFIETYAATKNFKIVLRNTSKYEDTDKYIAGAFRCKKSGKYEGARTYNFTTNRTGCPFLVRFSHQKHTDNYKITSMTLTHNHDDINNGNYI